MPDARCPMPDPQSPNNVNFCAIVLRLFAGMGALQGQRLRIGAPRQDSERRYNKTMQGMTGFVVPAIAVFAIAYILGVLILLLNGLSGVLEAIPHWIWTAALLSLTISVYRVRCY